MQSTCEICNVIATNEPEWEYHVKSNKHKKKLASVKKRKEVDEFLRLRREKQALAETLETPPEEPSEQL